MKYTAIVFLSLAIVSSYASEPLTLIKVKELGVLKNKVIFQSSKLTKTKTANLYMGKLIAQWGLHIFEVGNGLYSCNQRNICGVVGYRWIATYGSCLIQNEKANCFRKISGNNSSEYPTDEIIVDSNPDGVSDNFPGRNSGSDRYYDGPVRVGDDEFGTLF